MAKTKSVNKQTDGFIKAEKRSIIPAVLPPPAKVYTSNTGRGREPTLYWEVPEWDIAECGRICDVESFVKRAFRVKKNLFLKELKLYND